MQRYGIGCRKTIGRLLAAGSGAYVPVEKGGVQVDMNGSFVSVHALRTGKWSFRMAARLDTDIHGAMKIGVMV